ncbi:MAG TPA: ATP-binding protein [Gemmatimonadaceae bacterium]|nr:ATP-binding protein [Gemmatimonadaceae bacterium]
MMRRNSCRALVALGAALVASLAGSGPSAAQSPEKPVRILMLYGLSPELPEVNSFTRQLRMAVRRDVARPVEFYQEYLDLERFPGRGPRLASYFDDKYREFRIDAVVAVGAVALRFATDDLRRVLPSAPVVFALVNDRQLEGPIPGGDITGRIAPYPFASGLEMAHALQPDAERVVIIGGASKADTIAVDEAIQAEASRSHPLEVVLLRDITYADLLKRVARLPARTIVLSTTFRKDRGGQTYIPGELLAEITAASSAPVYGYTRTAIGQGIVGGAVVLPEQEAAAIGKLVMRVLRRAPGEALPRPTIARSTFLADWRQLQRWGLSERRLPEGTEVLFRTPSLWERYRDVVLASLGLIAVQALLILALLIERERRRRAQLALEDQMAYEQTIAELTTDAVRHAPQEAGPALEDALARVGRYAGASSAVLVQYSDGSASPPSSMAWSSATEEAVSPVAVAMSVAGGGAELEIPLVADGVHLGALALYQPNVAHAWSPRLVGRLGAAGELIAGAMARSRAVRAMREGEELNRAVLASLSAEIAILDRDGRIIRVNAAWREIAREGAVPDDSEAFVGTSYLDECRRAEARGCEEAQDVRRGIEAVLERRAWPFRFEYHCSWPVVRWCEVRVDCLEHEHGGAIVTHLDITDRRLAELRAEETRRQVAHMGRVAMIGELAATVSHELRQPLAAIRANAESGALLLARDPGDVAEAAQIFRDIVDDDIRATDIIDRTRMLLRNEVPRAAVVDVNDICRQSVQMLNRTAALQRARIRLVLDTGRLAVVGDLVQLQQVVLNLLLNAIDATTGAPGDRLVTVQTSLCDDHVEITVHDSGLGLPPNVQEHLFESFYSTKTQGLGMGLVIVRSIVERHRGRVSAENHVAGGAVFRIVLPKA